MKNLLFLFFGMCVPPMPPVATEPDDDPFVMNLVVDGKRLNCCDAGCIHSRWCYVRCADGIREAGSSLDIEIVGRCP